MRRLGPMALIVGVLFMGCSDYDMARSGLKSSAIIDITPGQKLEQVVVTGDTDIWLLTRPRHADESAEEHTLSELDSKLFVGHRTMTLREHE